jgi:hypothetical protein
LTINLLAVVDFKKGDFGFVVGHRVRKAVLEPTGTHFVIAMQDIKAGTPGWFEDNPRLK